MDRIQDALNAIRGRDFPAGEPCPLCSGVLFLTSAGPDGLREVGCMDCDLPSQFLALGPCGGWE